MGRLAEKLLGRDAASIASPIDSRRSLRERLSRGSVKWGPDAARVLALPRRPKPNLDPIVEELTARLKRPEGTQKLFPFQAWILWEAPRMGGLFGNVEVGGGKTLAGLLMPMVMPSCRRAVLFVPPSLRAQLLQRDWDFYSKHWVLPNLSGGGKFVAGRPVLHVVAYSELSSPKATELLTQLGPDLIICDEFHLLARHASARTKRFLRYLVEHHETRVTGWSGTMFSKSVKDCAHLAAVALGEGSPFPIHRSAVEEWAAAIDPGECFFDAGALKRFCNEGEDVRDAFRRRLVDTEGVVASAASALGTSLYFYERTAPMVPKGVNDALRRLRADWVRPDGEEFVEAVEVSTCARQLACGFYYRWRFPRREPPKLIEEWFARRQAWNRELREKLRASRPYLDSPKLCALAAERFVRGCAECGTGPGEPCEEESHPFWESYSWAEWAEIENKVEHETEAVWIDDFLVKHATQWALGEPGIVWVEHVEFGRALAKATGLPYYGGGKKASAEIIQESGKRSIIASVDAHHEGKNLQHAFSRNLILCFPTDAKTVEQLVGRTHRPGQPKDEVEVLYYMHTIEIRDAFEKAKERAKFLEKLTGSAQKMLYGTYANESESK